MSQPPSECRVCGHRQGRRLLREDDVYSRCARCGCLQKELTPEAYRALRPNYDPGAYLQSSSHTEIRAFLRVNDFRDALRKHLGEPGQTPAGKTFLDIGCGMGAFMLAARDLGMDVRGFEPSDEHGAIAREVFGLPVENAYFTAAAVGEARFDVIVLSHVIEHIYSPAAFLREVVGVLKPGGRLLMITPNADSLVARVTGSAWPMLDQYDHVTMLTPAAIGYVAPAGLAVRTTTSEYRAEFLATVLSVIKARFVRRQANRPGQAPPDRQVLRRAVSFRAKLLRLVLDVASLPFYALASALDRRAALITVLTKPDS